MAEEPDRTDCWLTLAVAFLAVAFQWPIYDRWLGLLDEGYMLGIAADINRGKVLYRDVTVDAPLPAAFHLLAAWFRLAGTSVESSRWLAVGGFALYVTFFFRIAREFLTRGYALALVFVLLLYRVWAFPHWQVYSYSLAAATLLTAATALVLAAVRRGSTMRLVLAGLCAGGAVVCKQDYGVGVTGALGLGLLILPWLEPGRPRIGAALGRAVGFGLAALAVILPVVAYFAWEGALDELIEQTILFPFSVMEKASYTRLPNLWPLFGQDPELRAQIGSYFPSILATLWWYSCEGCWVSDMSRGPLYQETAFWDVLLKLVYWAPLVVVGLAAIVWTPGFFTRRRRGLGAGESARLVLLLAFAGGFLLAFNPPRDWVHLMMIYPPAVLVGAVLLARTLQPLPIMARRAVELTAVGVMTVLAVVSVALMADLRRTVDWQLETPRGGVYADPSNGPIIADLLAYLEREVAPGTPVPVYPMQPMLAFLAGRETAGGYHVIWPFQAGDRDASIIADLEGRQVSHVVYSVSQYAHLRPFRENAPELYDHLVSRYEIDEVFSREPLGPLLLALRRRGPVVGVSLEELATGEGLRFEPWPFARVLTHAAGSREEPVTQTVAFDVPSEAAVLTTAVGVDPHHWMAGETGPVVFRAGLRTSPDGAVRPLMSIEIDPRTHVRDRRWHPVSLDLTDHAGESVELILSIEAVHPDEVVAGWREPRLQRPVAP